MSVYWGQLHEDIDKPKTTVPWSFFSPGSMETDGHRVRSACDGAEAFEAFRSEMPDLTILDLNLPTKQILRFLTPAT